MIFQCSLDIPALSMAEKSLIVASADTAIKSSFGSIGHCERSSAHLVGMTTALGCQTRRTVSRDCHELRENPET
jgi:hypothetical protein